MAVMGLRVQGFAGDRTSMTGSKLDPASGGIWIFKRNGALRRRAATGAAVELGTMIISVITRRSGV